MFPSFHLPFEQAISLWSLTTFCPFLSVALSSSVCLRSHLAQHNRASTALLETQNYWLCCSWKTFICWWRSDSNLFLTAHSRIANQRKQKLVFHLRPRWLLVCTRKITKLELISVSFSKHEKTRGVRWVHVIGVFMLNVWELAALNCLSKVIT